MGITDEQILNSIDAMPVGFDSHEVILHFAQHNQRVYAEALVAIEGDRLFHGLHTQLGIRIANLCDRLGYAREVDSSSEDIFGQTSKCMGWTKR